MAIDIEASKRDCNQNKKKRISSIILNHLNK